MEGYQPAPDKRFWVNDRGNPGTDGTMTAAALTLTTNSLTATLTPTDIMNLRNDVWSWIDGSNATSKKTRINVGRQSAGSEMFYVQGYAATPNWIDVSPTLTGDDQSVLSTIPSTRSWVAWYAMDGNSNPSQNTDLGHGTLPSGHDGLRINTKLPLSSVVNRLSIYKTGFGGTLAFDNMMVYGSSDSTNGTDGNWTTIAGPFTPTAPQRALANVWVNWDFMANATAFKWIRLEGDYNAAYATSFDYWTELRWFSFQTPAANSTWVDGQGNPATNGCLTAASITLTTNSQIASFGVSDVQTWKSNPWVLADDGQNITGRYKNVVLGSTVAGTERLKVIGFQGSGFSANQARLSGMSYFANSNATNQSWFEPPKSFDGVIAAASGGSGNGWAPGGGTPVWLVFKYQNGVTKVLNKFTLWREGDGSIPFASYSIYGSSTTTDGANGTWELLAGPFLPTIGGGQYYQTLSEDALFLDNKKAFNAYKIMGPVRGGRVLELEAYTYAPTPDKTFYVDAQGNPGTDGKMSAGSMKFTPLALAPDSPTTGTAYFDNPTRKLRVWDGLAWQDTW